MTLSAQELYRRGTDHVNAGRNAAARRSLTTALTRTTEPDLRARIAGTLSYVAGRTGDPGGAEKLCRDALAADGVSPATAAILEGQLGLLAVGRGDWTAAIDWLDRAIAGIGDDPSHRRSMYLNRSVAHMQSGGLTRARLDLEHAAADFAVDGSELDVAMVRHNLGYVDLLESNLIEALEQMSAAHPVLEASSVVNAAIGELDLAEVLREAGLTTEAERTLERVARTLGAHGMRQARGEAEFNLARSLLMHDPARAATVARAAARRFRSLGSTSWAARALALQLRAELGQPPSSPVTGLASGTTRVPSRARVEAAAADLDRLGFGSEATALRLSQQLWQARHERTVRGSGRSTDEAAEAVVRVPRDAPIQLRLLADEVRAARAGTAGRYAQARQRAARGLDTLAAWQRSFGSIDLQTSITMHATGLVTEGLAAAVASGRPEVLFEWSERARHLSQQVVPLRPPPDPELAADLAELRALRADNPSGWLADPRTAALQDRARRRQWSTTGVAGVNDQVTLDALQGGLGADTALLAYVATADGLSCLAVTADSARLFRLTAWPRLLAALTGLRADLDVSASVRSGPMAAVVARTLGERLADLEDVLLRNPLAAVGDRRIVLTAPGELAGLPWTLLPGLRGRPFTLAASATRWVHDRTQAGRPGVGFAAGPGVARGDEEVETGISAWTGVPAASAAAPRVVPQVLRGPAATVDAVAALASRVGVLHVAAHGRHAVDNPLFSGLELADGALFGYDIDRIGQVPQTVVLSACEVGRSAVRWGEEAIGMTRTWLHAGTSCVVAAPVAVADDAACELLGAMHTGLATGLAPAEALARAAGRTGVLAPFQCHGSGF